MFFWDTNMKKIDYALNTKYHRAVIMTIYVI